MGEQPRVENVDSDPPVVGGGMVAQLRQSRISLLFSCQRDRWRGHDLKRMDIGCTGCKTLHERAEGLRKPQVGRTSFQSCGKDGQVQIEPIRQLLKSLKTMIFGNDDKSRKF